MHRKRNTAMYFDTKSVPNGRVIALVTRWFGFTILVQTVRPGRAK